MIDPRLDATIRERFAAVGIDWRNAYLGEIEGELKAFPAAVAERCELPTLSELGPATVATALEPLRSSPSHRGELLSELRGGEFLSLLRREAEWALVQGEDEYVGWIADWNLREQTLLEREQLLARYRGRYALPLGTLWNSDHWSSSPLWRGTPLLAPDDDGLKERSGELRLLTPWGAEGWVNNLEIERRGTGEFPAELLRNATQMLGTPYRWGGRSPGGWDCSGFTQHCFAMAGVRLPRDAAQQALCGDAVEGGSDGWQAGDLLFFGQPADHVGIFDGRGAMLHASGLVRRQRLPELQALMGRLSAVRRLRGESAPAERTLWG